MNDLAGLMVSLDQIQYYLLMFVRVITMIALLPIFGAQYVPVQVKAFMGLLLTTALFSVQLTIGLPAFPGEFSLGLFFLLVIKEAMVGLAVGFASSFLFAAVNFAGRMVDTEMGFGFVEVIDPSSGEMATVLGQLQVILFTILFLLFNGHYFMLLTVQRSFEIIPLFTASFPGGPLTDHIASMTADVFILGLKLAAPVFVTLFLTQVALGIVARTVPQMNIFFVGLPLKILVGIATMIIVLPMLATLFRRMTEGIIQDIWKLLYLMSG
ncbi:MAG: flagellar biosynthetic protein FliR [Chitinispirillia bacterium]|nr:flagellar biosynthetic protein FliR [Chitinispirillia bacterium]MCL2268634.1 flagellar biosynthetic protein FliR [Chitinispirillia bacterium]